MAREMVLAERRCVTNNCGPVHPLSGQREEGPSTWLVSMFASGKHPRPGGALIIYDNPPAVHRRTLLTPHFLRFSLNSQTTPAPPFLPGIPVYAAGTAAAAPIRGDRDRVL